MSEPKVQRREFHKLTAAAIGGLVAGSRVAFADDKDAEKGKKDDERSKLTVDPILLAQEPHTCRGLNTCKAQGKGESNACAGQGACATVSAHSCNAQNDCKGQGGCGGYPGQNTCKSKGECATPLKKETWAVARKQFERLMKDLGKKVGTAPKS